MTQAMWETLPPQKTSQPRAPEAVYLVNAKGVIQFATPNAAHHYGYEVEEIIGRSVLHFIAPDDVEATVAWWRALLADPAAATSEHSVRVVSATGKQSRVRVTAWRLPQRDEFLLMHHLADQLRDRLDALYSILSAISDSLDLDYILDMVLREVQRLIPCHACTIYIHEHDGTIRVKRRLDQQLEDYRALEEKHLPEFETRRIIRETGQPVLITDCQADPRWVELSNHRLIRSWLGAPLTHRGEFFGELDLDSPHLNAFTEEDADLAMTLAGQIAARIYHARRYEEEARRAKRYQALNDVTLAISRLDLPSVLEVVYQKISQLMDASTFFIGLYDAEAGKIQLVGSYDHGRARADEIQDADVGLCGLVLRTCQSIIVHDSETEPVPDEVLVDGEMPRSILMMPLMTMDEIVGVISVQSYVPYAYTQDDIVMLEIIAGSVATAIRNAQLYDQTAARLAALEALQRTGVKLASAQTPNAVAELIIKAVLELFQPGQVRLFLSSSPAAGAKLWLGHLTGDINQPRIRAEENFVMDSLIERVERTQLPVVISDLSEHPEIQTEFNTPWLVQSLVAYPIMHGDQQLGVLTLLHGEPVLFRRDTLRTLELLCIQAATALQNARYYATLRARLDEVSALQDLARRVSSSRSLDEILQLTVDTMRDVYQCKSASLALVDEQLGEVITRAAAGLEPQYIEQARFKLGEPVAGLTAQTGQAVYVPDTHIEPNFRIIDPKVRSLMCVPLMVQDHVIGTLAVDSTQPYAFTPDHERVMVIAGGQIAAAIETVRLLEETRRRAAELAEANANLEALHELRNELVSNLSHELRSPLSLVRGYAGLMRDSELGPVSKEQIDALTIIDQKAESITRLITDILALEQIRRETLELAPVDINALCEQAVTGAQLIFHSRDLHFVADLAPGEYVVEGDGDRLNQVLDNLIGNAAKFSPDGATIRVCTRVEQPGCIQVSVIDQGIGIPADKLPHIFERFYQVDRSIKNRYGGAGLGLSIVQRIVEAHGGTVTAESQVGVGSTFTFTLPLAERE